ncbi:MAG: HAD family hydrolase, partial [Patescibacteria group bacterium]|nr:HAD family hydrolase [Patescibacteria group bacterium]
MGHGERENPETRKTKMAKALFAVDELTGLIVACALVNPAKLEGVKVKSIKKKFKKKEFAKGVNRDDIVNGAKELEVDLDEHLLLVLDAMKGIKQDLGL